MFPPEFGRNCTSTQYRNTFLSSSVSMRSGSGAVRARSSKLTLLVSRDSFRTSS
nr:MAG TPA: hypothetical protein [Caudoviricetes sp.]